MLKQTQLYRSIPTTVNITCKVVTKARFFLILFTSHQHLLVVFLDCSCCPWCFVTVMSHGRLFPNRSSECRKS